MEEFKQWSLVYVTPILGGEHVQRSRRLGIIISNDLSNRLAGISNIMLCSTKVDKAYLPINHKFFCRSTQRWNIAMANQIITSSNKELEKTGELLSTSDVEGIRAAISMQLASDLKVVDFEPKIMEVPKEIEIIKERIMADIDDKYQVYEDAKAFEEEARKATQVAYEDYQKSYADLVKKIEDHRSILFPGISIKMAETSRMSCSQPEPEQESNIIAVEGTQEIIPVEDSAPLRAKWTEEDIAILSEYVTTGIQDGDMDFLVKKLGRTSLAIKVKLSRLKTGVRR